MCKTCELKGIKMDLIPLDIETAQTRVKLPASWEDLKNQEFHPDLTLRAYAHLAWTERSEDPIWIGNARAFLSALGKGFLTSFDPSQFKPKPNDPYFELKTNALVALRSLDAEFGNRVSSVMWNSLAHLATRAEPEEKKSILKEADILPHHFGIVDTMLHAMGKVYTFALRVQSVFYEHTGMVLVHNCDCNCSLLNLKAVEGTIRFSLSPNERYEATQSLFTHQCAESHLILDQKLPFEYTITQEARLLFG